MLDDGQVHLILWFSTRQFGLSIRLINLIPFDPIDLVAPFNPVH